MLNPNQATWDEFDRMVDELNFRHKMTEIAMLPEHILTTIVSLDISITAETDPQRWN